MRPRKIRAIGAALDPAGNPDFYTALPASVNGILAYFMLLGRLEVFTVLVLLTPASGQLRHKPKLHATLRFPAILPPEQWLLS